MDHLLVASMIREKAKPTATPPHSPRNLKKRKGNSTQCHIATNKLHGFLVKKKKKKSTVRSRGKAEKIEKSNEEKVQVSLSLSLSWLLPAQATASTGRADDSLRHRRRRHRHRRRQVGAARFGALARRKRQLWDGRSPLYDNGLRVYCSVIGCW